MLGYNPLETLLADPTVSGTFADTYKCIYAERRGKPELASATFPDNAYLMRVTRKVVSRVGRHIDESNSMVDTRLSDGSRVNATVPSSAIDGPLLLIRHFAVNPLAIDDLVGFNTPTSAVMQLIDVMVKAKLNILILDGTGSGKTALLNTLSGYTPPDECVVATEDAAGL